MWSDAVLALPAAGYALFDASSHRLPASGQVEVTIRSPLDRRAYAVRRSLEVADHWQAFDVETDWPASSGSVDTADWLRANLDIPEDLPLSRVFHDILTFSLPATVAWLLEEAGLRERKFGHWLRTERYPTGVRWLETVVESCMAEEQRLQADAARMEGRDVLLPDIRQALENAHRGFRSATERVDDIQLQLANAEQAEQQMQALESELGEVTKDVQNRRATVAGLEVQVERWRHWGQLRERAEHRQRELEEEWQAYRDACTQIAGLRVTCEQARALETERHHVAGEIAGVRREQALLKAQLDVVHEAEETADSLAEPVQRQRQLEQQLGPAQEQVLRLELVNQAIQRTIAETKRVEVQLGEIDHQLAELEHLSGDAQRAKKLEKELEEQRQQAREAGKQVDHLRFLEAATRAVSGHLDELRKGAAATERLTIGASGNGSSHDEEKTVAGHLRAAIDHQLQALERQLRDWQNQTRDLSGAPARMNQLRASLHQIEQELAAARQAEVKLGGIAAIKQHRKSLAARLDQLKTTSETYLKQRQEHADAPAELSKLRHDLAALKEPRSDQQANLQLASRKDVLEKHARELQRQLAEHEQRRADLDQRLGELGNPDAGLQAQEKRRDQAHEGYCAYLTQQAIAQLAEAFAPELEHAAADHSSQRRLLEEAEARATKLQNNVAELRERGAAAPVLRAQLHEAQDQAAEWKSRSRQASGDFEAAQANHEALLGRQRELECHQKARQLVLSAGAAVRRGEVALGTSVRREIAAGAAEYLPLLLDEPEADVVWEWGEAPALRRAGVVYPLDKLHPQEQACCALALRLSLAMSSTRFSSVFVSGLGALQQSEPFFERLQRLPGIDQLLIPPGW